MSSNEQALDLTKRGIYKFWVSHTIRYSDLDTLGHVNNAVYSTFLEAGRAAFLRPIFQQHGNGRLDVVLARVIIDYRRELSYPGRVDIGTAIKSIGNRSVIFVNGIFTADTESEYCVATAQAHLVFFDLITRKSTLPPSAVRNDLETLIVGEY